MSTASPLGTFLRERRARVDPATIGLRTIGPRRTPGLRREEVATMAGISVEYLIRLERGRDRSPSEAVVRGLSAALRLDDHGAAHLAALAGLHARLPDAGDDFVDVTLDRMMQQWPYPAVVMNRFLDLLAVNDAGAALHAGIGLRPGVNMARAFFLDPIAEEVYLDQDQIADEVVANLRAMAGTDPEHPRLAELVGELSARSAQFAERWSAGVVAHKTAGSKRIHHPLVGDLTLDWTTLQISAAPGQFLVNYLAADELSQQRLSALVAAHTDSADTPGEERHL